MRKQIGLTRRDLEWIVQGMARTVPRNPAEAQRITLDIVMTLLEKNNAAIARALEADSDGGSSD